MEIRGDEVLAVFGDALTATRAGIDLQLARAEESATPSGRSVPAGVGIDAGESVREGVQYHSSHLNMAARLCSKALAGEVRVTNDALPCDPLRCSRSRSEQRSGSGAESNHAAGAEAPGGRGK